MLLCWYGLGIAVQRRTVTDGYCVFSDGLGEQYREELVHNVTVLVVIIWGM